MDVDVQSILESVLLVIRMPIDLVADRLRRFRREANEDARDLEDRHP